MPQFDRGPSVGDVRCDRAHRCQGLEDVAVNTVKDARDDERPVVSGQPHQVIGHRDQRGRKDVGQHDVERAVEVCDRCRRRGDPRCDTVSFGVGDGRFARRLGDVDGDDFAGAAHCGHDREHPAPAPGVEDALALADHPPGRVGRQACRRMVAQPEGAGRLDLDDVVWLPGDSVADPGRGDRQLGVHPHRLGMVAPRLRRRVVDIDERHRPGVGYGTEPRSRDLCRPRRARCGTRRVRRRAAAPRSPEPRRATTGRRRTRRRRPARRRPSGAAPQSIRRSSRRNISARLT